MAERRQNVDGSTDPSGCAGVSVVPPFARDSSLVSDAFRFAHERHHSESPDRPETKLDHVSAAAQLVAAAGFDDEVVAATLLHDVVEDTDATTQEIEERFGPRVGELVCLMTEDAGIEDYEERKAEHRGRLAGRDLDFAAVFAADKIAKIREIRRKHKGVKQRNLEHYEATLKAVANAHPELTLIEPLREELAACREEWDAGPR